MANHHMNPKKRRSMKRQCRKRDGNYCQECRQPFTLTFLPTIEHRTPLWAGGTNALVNLELLCGPCNAARNRVVVDQKTPYSQLALRHDPQGER